MAAGIKKPRQARVYLNEENQKTLGELASKLKDLSESQIVTLLLSASLRAIKENSYKMPLPLCLSISERCSEPEAAKIEPFAKPRK